MARREFETLTPQMFYILLALYDPLCGLEIMEKVNEMSEGDVKVGAGTLYALLPRFENEGYIKLVKEENKRKFDCLVLEGFAFLICYIPALKVAGFTIPTCILMSLFSFIIRMREKNVDKSDRKAVLKCAGIAVVYGVILTLVMEFAFTKWLNVRLP